MVNGLIVTHGALGGELLRVVELIMGPTTGLGALSNSGKSVIDLTREIEAWQESASLEDGAILFIDDMAGSCANAAQLAAGKSDRIRIVTGVNLAMLLDFVTWREGLDPEDLARRIIERGREAIVLLKSSGSG